MDPNIIGNLLYNYTAAYLIFNRMVLDNLYVFFNATFNVFLSIGIFISFAYLIMSILVLFTKIKYKEWTADASELPTVTVQIPTKNEIIALRCARKCLDFNYPKNKYEIIIGDDSTDASVSKELDKFASKHKQVRILRRKDKTGFKPGNLNNMLKYSKGEIIAIFDSDFAPGRDFLKRIVIPFIHDEKISAVQARWKFANPNKNIITILASTIVYTFHHITLTLMKKYNSGFLCGSAEAVRKKDLVKNGGWKSGSLTEDIEYSLRIHKNGGKIHYLPALECFNEVPSRPIDLYRQQMRWAHGVVSSYKIHSKDLLTTQKLSPQHKLLAFLGAFGYLIPIIIILTFVAGTLSVMTHEPEPINLVKFFSELGRNVILTSGLITASAISLYRAKKIKMLPKMLMASFSVGLVTTYYVNIGIVKAFMNKPMEWYLLAKSKR